jgi:hypothetical protein
MIKYFLVGIESSRYVNANISNYKSPNSSNAPYPRLFDPNHSKILTKKTVIYICPKEKLKARDLSMIPG